MRKCAIPICEDQANARGLCRPHYDFFRKERRLTEFPKVGGKYGHAHPKVKAVLSNVLTRCTSPKDPKFKYYGGRGIKTFLTIEDIQFLWDRDGAVNMDRPSIDRMNSDGHYTKDNCRFIEHVANVKRGWLNRKRARGAAISAGLLRRLEKKAS